ncbi:hypothetical protein SAMN04487934_11421 [Eubacterium ruminantium]|nr:hypothetical protein SAMN04487934_11421 [Eubacterium ruminantium]
MELIEFAQIKEKGKVNNATREEFQDKYLELLEGKGICDETIHFAISCTQLGSSLSINKWLLSLDQEQCRNNASLLLNSKAFIDEKNRYSAYCFAFRLLALNGGVVHNQIITEEVIKTVSFFVSGVDTNWQKKLSKIIKTHLINALGIHINFVELTKLEIDERNVRVFSEMLNRCLIEIVSDKITDDERRKVSIVQEWVTLPEENKGSNIIDNGTRDELSLNHENENVNEIKKDNQAENNNETENNKEDKQRGSQLIKDIYSIAERVSNQEKQLIMLNAKSKKIQAELQHKIEENERLKQKIQGINTELDQKNNLIENLKNEISDRNVKISSLEEEVKNKNQFIEFQENENAVSEEEMLNTIAAELKIYYDEMNEAKGMELSSDMAGVLLDDLHGVFLILKKHGIHIE